MNIDIRKSFYHNIKKITDKTTKAEVKQAILAVKKAQTIRDIPELRKLEGYKKGIFYRIAVGNYRIGITIEDNLVTFAKCLPRKDFYKFYP